MIQFISKRKIWYTVSILLVAASIVSLAWFGLNFGIDFTGGSISEVEFINERPEITVIHDKVNSLEFGNVSVQPTGDKGVILRQKELTEDEHQVLLTAVFETAKENLPEEEREAITRDQYIEELRFESIGPSIGKELREKSIYAIILVVVCIILYIAWAFRKVSHPVASWKYGVIAVIALIHDILITVGVFAILGYLLGIELNTPFVAALLTILGYSVNDTIVIFDRVRENLFKHSGEFDETINKSINETLARSINTSLTTLVVLLVVFFFGGETIKDFVLALMIGIFLGGYSSIFVASPLLVTFRKFQKK